MATPLPLLLAALFTLASPAQAAYCSSYSSYCSSSYDTGSLLAVQIGAGVGSIVLFIIIVVACCCFWRRRRTTVVNVTAPPQPQMPMMAPAPAYQNTVVQVYAGQPGGGGGGQPNGGPPAQPSTPAPTEGGAPAAPPKHDSYAAPAYNQAQVQHQQGAPGQFMPNGGPPNSYGGAPNNFYSAPVSGYMGQPAHGMQAGQQGMMPPQPTPSAAGGGPTIYV